MPEAAPRPGPIECRGFVQFLGDALQPGQEHQHVVAKILPDREQDQGGHRPMRIAQPVHRTDADHAECRVEQAVLRVVDVPPHQRHRHKRGDPRGEERAPEERLEAHQLRIDQDGGEERHRRRERAAHHHEIERVAQCDPELRTGGEVVVILETDNTGVAEIRDRIDVEIGEGQDERAEHRDRKEDPDQQQRRRDERPPRPRFGARVGVDQWLTPARRASRNRRRSSSRSTSVSRAASAAAADC